MTWLQVLEPAPVVAFAALSAGWHTSTKIATGVALVPAVVRLGQGSTWWCVQLPLLLTSVALCLGLTP
ncbi:hypothetical protein [Nocardia sp. NRRL S-836]|uniref:hypothetical protein n=1 Tax=Nocardia sp. NRRL S-836 TaxID=1519492 RepID=UPI0006ADC4F0|nr:hypothetical protein [Nocardia sp. NRRL S-836]KOV89984.1 hypothetical protein ADL03_00960 [Nocardia sp. NRRL S-836]